MKEEKREKREKKDTREYLRVKDLLVKLNIRVKTSRGSKI